MKRSTVIGLSLLSLVVFVGLVYYGWTHRWGGPSDYEVKPPSLLSVPRKDLALSLQPDDFDAAVWSDLEPLAVPLLHQVTAAPHGTTLVRDVRVRAFHNGTDAYFLFEWQDSDESRAHGVAEFPDAVAVAFSLSREPPKASIMMGFQSTVNIWQWKANLDSAFWKSPPPAPQPSPNDRYTYEEPAKFPVRTAATASACQDLLSGRPGTVDAKDQATLAGRGRWRDGTWRVIVKRSLATGDAEKDVQIAPGRLHAAFAVWNGGEGDRGSRKSISDWVIIDVRASARATAEAPAKRPSARRAPRPWGFSLLPSAHADVAKPETQTDTPPRVITIKARRFEYMPSEITVRKGERITFRLESLDVTHGLYLDAYGINIKANPTQVGKATFVADKGGRFTFRCSETCGEFHPYMIGYLTVTPNTRFTTFVVITLVACAAIAGGVLFASSRKKGAAPDA